MKPIIQISMFLLASISTGNAEPARPTPMQGTETAASPHVELYVTDWCGYCKKAEAFLKSHNIPYTRYNVEQDPAAARRKVSLGGGSGVPFAMIDGRPVSGFKESTYRMLLRTAN